MVEDSFNEVQGVHSVFIRKPELFEKLLGISLDKDSLKHHYSLPGGRHIDFVLKNLAGTTYLIEVKLSTNPLDVMSQLLDTEMGGYLRANSEADPSHIKPVLLIDSDSVDEVTRKIFSQVNIILAEYNLDEIKAEYETLSEEIKEASQTTIPELPDLAQFQSVVNKSISFMNEFADFIWILEGCQGDAFWDGYYDFRAYWRWRDHKDIYPQLIYELLYQKKDIENIFWITFLWAISDDYETATTIFKKGWTFKKVHKAFEGKTSDWKQFKKYVSHMGNWLQDLWKSEHRIEAISEYLEKVGKSQKAHFDEIISKASSPFEAYDLIWEDIVEISHVGRRVAAPSFCTWLAQCRILPIIPTDKIRKSRFVKRVIDNEPSLRKLGDNTNQVITNLARKYSVLPSVIERAFHKVGRQYEP